MRKKELSFVKPIGNIVSGCAGYRNGRIDSLASNRTAAALRYIVFLRYDD